LGNTLRQSRYVRKRLDTRQLDLPLSLKLPTARDLLTDADSQRGLSCLVEDANPAIGAIGGMRAQEEGLRVIIAFDGILSGRDSDTGSRPRFLPRVAT
jgi:hypothetical protein